MLPFQTYSCKKEIPLNTFEVKLIKTHRYVCETKPERKLKNEIQELGDNSSQSLCVNPFPGTLPHSS